MTAETCRHGVAGERSHLGELVADEIERSLERTKISALSAGEPADAWEQGSWLLSRAAAGVREYCQWLPDPTDDLREAQLGYRVAAKFLAAAALNDFRAAGNIHHNLMVLHEVYSAPLRSAFGAPEPLYARLAAPANPRTPDLPRLAVGAPAQISGRAVMSAAAALAAAQRLAALHLRTDATAPGPPGSEHAYREGFAAAIATTEEIASSSGVDSSAGDAIEYRVEVTLLREVMASYGELLDAWAADLNAGETRTQAQAHAVNLMDGKSALPELSFAAAPGMELIAAFFNGLCEDVSRSNAPDASVELLVADTLRTHFGGLAAAMRELPEHARIEGQLFMARLPDIHLLSLMERIGGTDPVLLRSGMGAFVHGQGLAADALAGSASACASGELREALDYAAGMTEFRAGMLAGSARRALDALAGR